MKEICAVAFDRPPAERRRAIRSAGNVLSRFGSDARHA
jgi:hypothetical protein